MALNVARHLMAPDVKAKGMYGSPPLVAFTSCQGHESLEKACAVLGIGAENLVRVPVVEDKNGMDARELRRLVEDAKARGARPLFVNATAGTTVAGAFDPFVEIRKAT